MSIQSGSLLNRRGLLLGLASALAAPAIVHAGNIMPVKTFPEPSKALVDLMNDLYYGDHVVATHYWFGLDGKVYYHNVTADEFYVA